MVGALDSGWNGPGSSLGRGTVLCSWARPFTLMVPLSTQVYKWVPENFMLHVGGNPAMDQHPIQGGVVLVASCCRNQDKLRPDERLGSYADSTLTFT